MSDSTKVVPKQKYWMGSPITKCDLCQKAIEKYFVDGKTTIGPWGILCIVCHNSKGCGIGMGRGQMYCKQDDGKWLKIGG